MNEVRHNSKMIWINGKLLPEDEVRISPLDRGFLVGEGVFETLRSYNGHPFATKLHWQRLCDSSNILALTPPTESVFTFAVKETLRVNGIKEARIRVSLSRGIAPDSAENIMTISVMPAPLWPPTSVVSTVPWTRNERSPLAGAKCLSYAENTVALAYVKARGADEAIFSNTRGEVCEGSTSNVFFVHENQLVTPPLSSGCLGGITRTIVLNLCREHGIPVEETSSTMQSFVASSEAFLTSTTREVHPISRIDDQTKNCFPDSITGQVAALFKNFIHQSFPS